MGRHSPPGDAPQARARPITLRAAPRHQAVAIAEQSQLTRGRPARERASDSAAAACILLSTIFAADLSVRLRTRPPSGSRAAARR